MQLSIANNLNDIAKDHPTLAIEACRRLAQDAPAGCAWTIRYALRAPVKAGNSDAIRILGGDETPHVRIGTPPSHYQKWPCVEPCDWHFKSKA